MVGAVTMVRQDRLSFKVFTSRCASSVLSLGLLGCASASTGVHVGTSVSTESDADEEEDRENDRDDENDSAEESDPEDDSGNTDEDGVDGEQEGFSAHREPPEARLARAALHAATPADNHMGLVMAIAERTSDLPWVLAIENRSPHPITLAALPDLLTAKIIPPPPAAAPEEDTSATKSQTPKESEPPEPIVCGAKSLPKSIDADEQVELAPGQLLFHAFDPRDLCDQEDVFEEGGTVEMTYGFPIQTKKLWRGGKLTTVEVEQTAPFVAERPASGEEEIVPLKHLKADPIRLDQTYPLSQVSALPTDDDEKSGEDDESETPPPPLNLTISPLGTTSRPEDGVVRVQLRNTSGKPMKLFIRRELFTYEVSGPHGEATCHMLPAERSPDPAAFISLSPGETYSISTRLAEACPPGTWDDPGTYSVSAYFQTTADGEEHGISAFMGSAATHAPARLIVPGSEATRRRRMILLPVEPPTPTPEESSPTSPQDPDED